LVEDEIIHRICDRMMDKYIYVPSAVMRWILLKVLILMLSEDQVPMIVDYKCDGYCKVSVPAIGSKLLKQLCILSNSDLLCKSGVLSRCIVISEIGVCVKMYVR